jgi:hypothetical protein
MLLEKVGIALLMMFLSTIIHALFMIGGSHALTGAWRVSVIQEDILTRLCWSGF